MGRCCVFSRERERERERGREREREREYYLSTWMGFLMKVCACEHN